VHQKLDFYFEKKNLSPILTIIAPITLQAFAAIRPQAASLPVHARPFQ
jgi:hypothetical protein